MFIKYQVQTFYLLVTYRAGGCSWTFLAKNCYLYLICVRITWYNLWRMLSGRMTMIWSQSTVSCQIWIWNGNFRRIQIISRFGDFDRVSRVVACGFALSTAIASCRSRRWHFCVRFVFTKVFEILASTKSWILQSIF